MNRQVFLLLAGGFLCGADVLAADLVEQDRQKLQGTWVAIGAESDGVVATGEQVKAANLRVVFVGDKIRHEQDGKIVQEGTYRVDPESTPKTIDTQGSEGREELGIYRLVGDQLIICTSIEQGARRPVDFVTEAGSGRLLITLERAKPERE